MNLLFSKPKVLQVGANSHIKSQLNALRIERDILTKTISRLYQHDVELSKIQRDKLLIRYQHQLGIVLAKIDKLEAASKHPDLGPLGDGLITLMDQKLSQLDKRLYELTSKINVANSQITESKAKNAVSNKKLEETNKVEVIKQIQTEPTKNIPSIVPTEKKPIEITTLTEIPTKITNFPFFEKPKKDIQLEIMQEQIEKPQNKIEEKIEVIQTNSNSNEIQKEQIKNEITKSELQLKITENKPKPTVKLPKEENIEDDEDDLDKIKGEIMKTLSKLEQAEVE